MFLQKQKPYRQIKSNIIDLIKNYIDEALSTGAQEPRDPVLMKGMGWVSHDGGGIFDQMPVLQSGETELHHPCDLHAGIPHSLLLCFAFHLNLTKPGDQYNS